MPRGDSTPAFDTVDLVLPGAMYGEIQSHLGARTDREQIGLLMAGTASQGRTLRLLGREYVVPREEDLDQAHYTGTGLTPQFNNAVLSRAVKENTGAIVRIHTHQFCGEGVRFSGVDDHFEREEAKWLLRHFPQLIFASVVFGRTSVDARAWSPANGSVRPVPAGRIVAWDFPLRLLWPEGAPARGDDNSPEFDRQVRAFGREGQARMGAMQVGIAGLGGMGSLVAEGLARLGVRRFVLVDQDKVDESNRNRLLGVTADDASRQRFKVNVARREILQVSRECQVTRRFGDVASPRIAESLKGCDLIVAATDNEYSRLFLQTLCAQYLIPLLNLGAVINASAADGTVEDAYGSAQLWLPGKGNPCMSCAGMIDARLVSMELAPEAERQELQDRGYIHGADVPAPQVRPLNGVTVNLALALFHNFVCGYARTESAVGYDMLTQEIERYDYRKDDDCRICGKHGVLARGDSLRMTYFRE